MAALIEVIFFTLYVLVRGREGGREGGYTYTNRALFFMKRLRACMVPTA